MKVLTQFERKPLLFADPEFIISCTDPALFKSSFKEMEAALSQGYYLAGFLSYEAGYYFEEKLYQDKQYDFPLIYLGAYKHLRKDKIIQTSPGYRLENLRLNITPEQYSLNINTIRDYIAKGDVYQITYCLKLLFDFYGDPLALYYQLLREQPVPYPAYIQTDEFQVLSLSPELFIKKNSSHLVTKPMKGTWPRGNSIFSDFIAPLRLKYDRKNRAENVMIADLLRNDLGRLGANIKAPTLFEVARYKTLCQMTSTVTAKVKEDISIYKLFSAIFPSGSVTGAPKIRAMGIINELEKDQRKIYTGAIGFITPDKDMFFNIPIRTLLIKGKSAEMGIGGGIVWDSTPAGEWNEGLLKAKFLTDLAKMPFSS
ncbi:MAG: chorismate-binding protein [Candidatus Omnitrophica bacterium]|nr:chorismate-binding protein [Candidatus Omnitrophota bacterium]MBU4303827.1 chorismate-binding protein [Candidatus Omnitrophota bacterium]MBU4468018.1 chorismate-binding protein [Candidatus Omnitrophota bacterium]MCG2707815.1 chorismate-binding protein [Candidatus Omnitrophota bacterium]